MWWIELCNSPGKNGRYLHWAIAPVSHWYYTIVCLLLTYSNDLSNLPRTWWNLRPKYQFLPSVQANHRIYCQVQLPFSHPVELQTPNILPVTYKNERNRWKWSAVKPNNFFYYYYYYLLTIDCSFIQLFAIFSPAAEKLLRSNIHLRDACIGFGEMLALTIQPDNLWCLVLSPVRSFRWTLGQLDLPKGSVGPLLRPLLLIFSVAAWYPHSTQFTVNSIFSVDQISGSIFSTPITFHLRMRAMEFMLAKKTWFTPTPENAPYYVRTWFLTLLLLVIIRIPHQNMID